MNSASVSVVIPCYKCADTIVHSLRSVAEQTVRVGEVVLVEDGAGMAGVDLGRVAAEALPRDVAVRVIVLERNRGPSIARNVGWNAAREEWVAFLDADDSWHPQKVELITRLLEHEADAVLAGHGIVVTPRSEPNVPQPRSLVRPVRLTLREFAWKNWLGTATVLVRRSVEARFPEDMRYCEDYMLWALIAAAHPRGVLFVPTVLAYWHKPPFGSDGLSGDLSRMRLGELRVLRTILSLDRASVVRRSAVRLWAEIRFIRRLILSMWFGWRHA